MSYRALTKFGQIPAATARTIWAADGIKILMYLPSPPNAPLPRPVGWAKIARAFYIRTPSGNPWSCRKN